MTHRAYLRHGGETRLDSYRDYDRRPSSNPTKGFCGCGVETSRNVTVGPPGHPENGWECRDCGELRLKLQFEKFIQKNV